MGYLGKDTADKYQGLFNFFSQEHDLTLTISEMDEVITEVENFKEQFKSKNIRQWKKKNT